MLKVPAMQLLLPWRQGRSHGGEWGGSGPPLLFWRSFLILSKPGRNVWGGGQSDHGHYIIFLYTGYPGTGH